MSKRVTLVTTWVNADKTGDCKEAWQLLPFDVHKGTTSTKPVEGSPNFPNQTAAVTWAKERGYKIGFEN